MKNKPDGLFFNRQFCDEAQNCWDRSGLSVERFGMEGRMIQIVKKGPDTCFYSDGLQAARVIGRKGYTDSFEEMGNGVYRWMRKGEPADRMEMELRACFRPDFTMVPGLNYHGNGWGTFCEYTSDRYFADYRQTGIPWKYGWHRASVAAMTYSEKKFGERVVGVALFGDEEGANACQLYEENGETVHRLCWPEEETPKTLDLYRFSEPWYGKAEPRSVFAGWIVIEENGVEKVGYAKALDAAWKQNDRERPLPYSKGEIWRLAVAYAKTLFTREADGFCGFSIGMSWNGKEWEKRKYNKYEIGWCGQNASFANSLLWEAMEKEEKETAQMGIRVLDSWLKNAMSPAGVVCSYYDPGQVRTLEACDLGTAGCAYFEAAALAEELADRDWMEPETEDLRERAKAYRKAAFDICDFAVRMQDEKGAFAKSWYEDGSVAVREGTVGAFLSLPLIDGYRLSGNGRYLDAARSSMEYYLQELEESGFTTAGALDIFSIDKESSIPLLKGAIGLYELTGEERWLEGAKRAAWYLSTWQYSHTCRFDRDCLLGQTGYDSFGGTLVSTVHEGIDPFALCYIPELYELYRITGQERWLSRARAIWRNGCQHISDGTLVIDGKLRPEGSQDESYTVTRQGERGIASQWLVAWPGAFRMEAIRRLAGKPGTERIFGE